MLLLRTILGATAIIHGGFYIFEQKSQIIWTWFFGLSAIACGVSLVAGFLTPLFGLLVCTGSIAFVIFFIPAAVADWAVGIYTIVVSAAVAMLGPGAYSLDARMFGRREIIIPNHPRPPEY